MRLLRSHMPWIVVLVLALSGCGSSSKNGVTQGTAPNDTVPQAHPQAVQPRAGVQAQIITPQDPVGDPHAHAPPLSEVRQLLRQELVIVPKTNATYINPLRFVTVWGRTDQGVDAQMPVGAPILAPCRVKILAIITNCYAGQPLVYYELL